MNDMKKGLIFVLFALVSIVSYSQISWNAKVGMNMSNFTGDMDTDMRIGFNVGVGMEYQFSDMWSIQPSLMFTQKGAKQDEVKMNPMYLEIPVLAAARFAIADNQNIVVKAGPYFAFGIAGKCKIGDEKIDFFGDGDDQFGAKILSTSTNDYKGLPFTEVVVTTTPSKTEDLKNFLQEQKFLYYAAGGQN